MKTIDEDCGNGRQRKEEGLPTGTCGLLDVEE